MNPLELTGQAATHVVELNPGGLKVHQDAAQPLRAMAAVAAAEGIELAPVSGFRDFPAQLRIWNEKFTGRRTLYDRTGHALDFSVLSPEQVVDAILNWSALPGASRHHWGSEVDVIDRAALPAGGRFELLPAEFAPGGPFARLDDWLTRHMREFGFFRPYGRDRGGVAPEPWHLSYAPVSVEALEQTTEDLLREALQRVEMEGKEIVLRKLPDIYRQYITNIEPPDDL